MKTIQVGFGLCLLRLVSALEVGVPERFLRPRTFNPHPYTATEDAASQNYPEDNVQLVPDVSSLPHPYRFFERPPTRGEPSSSAPIQFPKVPDAAQIPAQQSRLKPPTIKHPLNINNDIQYEEVPVQRLTLQRVPVQRIRYEEEPLQQVAEPIQYYQSSPADSAPARPSYRPKTLTPKNYAFSYAVRDGLHGDDFSHSQAHSNAQTKGEYRVKLPDGRTQVVSYTADDHGYRADVRYDEENSVEPSYERQQPVIKYKPIYKTAALKNEYKPIYQVQYRPKPNFTPIHEDQSETSPSPKPSSPQLYNGGSTPSYFVQSSPAPFTQQKYYSNPSTEYYAVSSTPAPLYYPSSTVPPQYTPSQPAHEHNYYLIH